MLPDLITLAGLEDSFPRFWQSFHLESVSSYHFMICFHGHFVGELKEIVSSPSYQITVETGNSYMELLKKHGLLELL